VWSDSRAEAKEATKAVQARRDADDPDRVAQDRPALQSSQRSSQGQLVDVYM
jgi:hypothetical protein